MQGWSKTTVAWGLIAAGALVYGVGSASAQAAFGQETVETRQPRNPHKQGTADKHDAHKHGSTHGGHGHSHKSGKAHAHGQRHAGSEPGHSHRAGEAAHKHAHGPGQAAHAHGTGTQADSHGHGHREALTEFLFGFVTGTDIGDPGDRHLVFDVTSGFGKATGTYGALWNNVEVAFTPWQNFHVGLHAGFAYHRISGVKGLEEPQIAALEAPAAAGEEAAEGAEAPPRALRRNNGVFDGLGLEFRQRFLDREYAPFGLTFVVEPHWARVEEVSGDPVHKHAVGFLLAADKDIVRDTLFVAFNAFYEPEWLKLLATGEYERESTVGLGTAGMLRLSPSFFIGGDARYLRKYEGAALNTLAGEALFVGPTLFATLGHSYLLTAAFEAQVWGRVPGEPGSLDLDNFTRYQAKLRLVAHF
ncbi:MAG: hypothetical protein ACXWU0_04440 [Rhodoplanes sp.]